MRLLGSVTAIAFLAGCQNSGDFGVSDVKPSKFILGLLNPKEETSSAKETVSAAPTPAPAALATPAPALAPLETIALSPEYVSIDSVSATDDIAPVYVEQSDAVAVDTYAFEEPALTLTDQEVPAAAFIENTGEPAAAYVEEAAIAYIEEPVLPLAVSEPDTNFVSTETIVEPIPTLDAPATAFSAIVDEQVETAALPAEPAFVGERAEALEIEVAVPTNLDDIAPPPILGAAALPSIPVIEEAPLDAPVLPSTEIIESELAPLASEIDTPPVVDAGVGANVEAEALPRPTFTPIPQPGLATYGSAF